MLKCQAPIQQGNRKGELCGKETENKYCNKHKRQEIIDRAIKENIKYCDVARGCYTVLEDNQSKCEHCLHKARIRDRKRDDKKRQDDSLCLDCGRILTSEIRAKGKHDKKLRRCIPCYEKLQKYESQRTPRERNYKEEAFTNKHVAWNHYVKGAQKRGIDFKLTKTKFNELIIQKCFYCNYFKEGEINGIDRIDNNEGYYETNVVSCCQVCNLMKGSQHPQEFLDKLNAIHNFKVLSEPIQADKLEKWKTTYLSLSTPKYKNYAKSANSRNIEFKLSEKEFKDITSQQCYLCGVISSDINTNGIDRFDNSKGYILENCKPCCGHCNILKKDLTYDKIIKTSKQISQQYDKLTEFMKIKNIAIRTSKTEPRIKVENPVVEEPVERVYKPTNEVIITKKDAPEKIQEILKPAEEPLELKQWKVKQIYEAIQANSENTYKNIVN